jgi:uncharacterized membrane protein
MMQGMSHWRGGKDMEHGEVILDMMLVVVFDSQQKAFEGRTALQELENDGRISIYASAVIAKNSDGPVAVLKIDGPRWFGPLVGSFLGSIVGLLGGGPPGAAIGAAVGLGTGAVADANNLRISRQFMQDVNKQLAPGTFALLAEVTEGWTSPVDERMRSIGGTVFRRALWDVADTADDEEVDAMKLAIDQMKLEHSEARADRKAKLEAKIQEVQTTIRERLEKHQKRRQAFREEVRKLSAEQ